MLLQLVGSALAIIVTAIPTGLAIYAYRGAAPWRPGRFLAYAWAAYATALTTILATHGLGFLPAMLLAVAASTALVPVFAVIMRHDRRLQRRQAQMPTQSIVRPAREPGVVAGSAGRP